MYSQKIHEDWKSGIAHGWGSPRNEDSGGGNESTKRVKIFGMRPDFSEGKLCCPFVRPKVVQVSDCNQRPMHVSLIEHVWYMMSF